MAHRCGGIWPPAGRLGEGAQRSGGVRGTRLLTMRSPPCALAVSQQKRPFGMQAPCSSTHEVFCSVFEIDATRTPINPETILDKKVTEWAITHNK